MPSTRRNDIDSPIPPHSYGSGVSLPRNLLPGSVRDQLNQAHMDREDRKMSELRFPSFDGAQGEYSDFRSSSSMTEGPLPRAQPFRMMIRRATRETHLVDLLDRILDKGIVIDVRARLTVAGLDLGITVKARIVVASIETYLEYAGPGPPRRR